MCLNLLWPKVCMFPLFYFALNFPKFNHLKQNSADHDFSKSAKNVKCIAQSCHKMLSFWFICLALLALHLLAYWRGGGGYLVAMGVYRVYWGVPIWGVHFFLLEGDG